MPVRINGEGFTVVSSPKVFAETDWTFEVAGPDSASLLLSEEGQAAPKGRFRLRGVSNQLKIQQAATEPNPKLTAQEQTYAAWASATDLVTIDQAARSVTFHNDIVTNLGYQVEQHIRELIERVDTLSDQNRYLILALADIGFDLPDSLLATLGDVAQHPVDNVLAQNVGV